MKWRSMKQLLALLPILVTGVVAPARAEPVSIPCWFFRGEKLELQQTCISESHTWIGGGMRWIRWQDGVQTNMAWGLQGRGERPCVDISVDGVCGVSYGRHPTTLKRISNEEWENRRRKNQPTIGCIQVQDKSICYAPIVK